MPTLFPLLLLLLLLLLPVFLVGVGEHAIPRGPFQEFFRFEQPQRSPPSDELLCSCIRPLIDILEIILICVFGPRRFAFFDLLAGTINRLRWFSNSA